MRTLLCALLALALPVPVHADAIYGYVGNPFAVVSGIYEAGDHLVGSITLPDGFVPDEPYSWVHIPAYSFTDGHQTLTQENSSAVFDRNFTATVLGSGNDWWYIDITGLDGSRMTSTHGMGSCCNLHDRTAVGASFAYSTIGYPDMASAGAQGTWTISTPELVIFPKLLPRLLGWGVEAKITYGLQRATTWAAAAILRAPHSATEIYLPALTVQVIEECAGYQTLGLMLLMAAFFCAIIPARRLLCAIAIVVAALVFAIEANALRVVLIALGGEHRDAIQYATTALAIGQLVGLARLVQK